MKKSCNRLTRDLDTALLLMNVETALRDAGKNDLADRLDKLQRDITGWYAHAETDSPKEGELVKPFVENYEALTPKRVNETLRDVHTALSGGDLKVVFGTLVEEACIPEISQAKVIKAANLKL